MNIETTSRYCPICATEVDAPVDTMVALAAAPGLIAEAVRAAPREARAGWSPAEVAAHLADTEVVTGWRLRQILSEDEPMIQPYDQEEWAAALRYQQRDPELALEAFAAARRANLELLRLLSDEEWERTCIQPEYGRQTLRTRVRHKSDHDIAHLRQIRGE